MIFHAAAEKPKAIVPKRSAKAVKLQMHSTQPSQTNCPHLLLINGKTVTKNATFSDTPSIITAKITKQELTLDGGVHRLILEKVIQESLRGELRGEMLLMKARILRETMMLMTLRQIQMQRQGLVVLHKTLCQSKQHWIMWVKIHFYPSLSVQSIQWYVEGLVHFRGWVAQEAVVLLCERSLSCNDWWLTRMTTVLLFWPLSLLIFFTISCWIEAIMEAERAREKNDIQILPWWVLQWACPNVPNIKVLFASWIQWKTSLVHGLYCKRVVMKKLFSIFNIAPSFYLAILLVILSLKTSLRMETDESRKEDGMQCLQT